MQNKSAADGIQLHAPAQQGTRIDGSASWEARCGTHRAGKLELMRHACGHSSQAAPGRLAHLPPQVLATFEAGSHRLKLTARH